MQHHDHFPRLRPIQTESIRHAGQPALLLKDPLQLTDRALVVSAHLVPALILCDGATHRSALPAALTDRFGLTIDTAALDELLLALDELYLLDNERAAAARHAAGAAYRAAPQRTPALAGRAYPADPAALQRLLAQALAQAETSEAPAARAVLSPHIDYRRGSAVYAQVWRQAARAARDAELVILIGTDHYGAEPISLTRQHYATPLGVLPTDFAIIDALADAIGAEAAYAGELYHRNEHSLELVAIWLQQMRGERACPIVPILCGSLMGLAEGPGAPAEHAPYTLLIEALREVIRTRRTLIVASGDMAHVGPAFGGRPLDGAAKAQLHNEDHTVIARLCAGDATGFFRSVAATGDRNNICGLAPFYLTLALLGESSGALAGYLQCPADEHETSVVSICGMTVV
jgi:hypothetical protein